MKKLLLLLTLLLWLPIAQANQAEYQRGYEAYKSGNYKTAIHILRPLAEKEHAGAQYWLAKMYEKGQEQGPLQNYAEALKWYGKVATQNRVPAYPKYQKDTQRRIAWWYWEGIKAPKNNIYAYMWHIILKTEGDAWANNDRRKRFTKGMSYEEITRAQALATKCWESNYKDCPERAQANTDFATLQYLAVQGDAGAQYNLGEMYYKGHGAPQSYIHSYMWLRLAEVNGVKNAQELIKELTGGKKAMSTEDIATAQSLAIKCWNSKYQDCSE